MTNAKWRRPQIAQINPSCCCRQVFHFFFSRWWGSPCLYVRAWPPSLSGRPRWRLECNVRKRTWWCWRWGHIAWPSFKKLSIPCTTERKSRWKARAARDKTRSARTTSISPTFIELLLLRPPKKINCRGGSRPHATDAAEPNGPIRFPTCPSWMKINVQNKMSRRQSMKIFSSSD